MPSNFLTSDPQRMSEVFRSAAARFLGSRPYLERVISFTDDFVFDGPVPIRRVSFIEVVNPKAPHPAGEGDLMRFAAGANHAYWRHIPRILGF
jgi:hypothetical protein